MCHFASLVLTKDHAYFGTTDSHEDIIKEHKLHEGAGRVNFLRVEIVPPHDDASAPLESWTYSVDQDEMPKWHDADGDEKRARAALKASGLPPAQDAYDKAAAPARDAYRRATTSEQDAYNKATASAWNAYDKATASAWNAYDKAAAPARDAYRRATTSE